jgi:hypothetical protein
MNDFECPDEIYADLDDGERQDYLGKTIVETNTAEDEQRVYCAVPKISAPLSCEAAEQTDLLGKTGWTYCENDEICDYRVNASALLKTAAAGHFFAYRCTSEII